MQAEEFLKKVEKTVDKDYGICPPPSNAQFCLDVLIEHFLGKDWYVSTPMGREQVNTEAVYQILRKYPKKSSKSIFYKLWKKLFY